MSEERKVEREEVERDESPLYLLPTDSVHLPGQWLAVSCAAKYNSRMGRLCGGLENNAIEA